MNYLESILDELKNIDYPETLPYYIPNLWNDPFTSDNSAINVNPKVFFSEKISAILNFKNSDKSKFSKNESIIYNMFPRLTCAFDHDQSGSVELDSEYFRQTGTLLKAIALLPYIKSLGVNIVYLLPITSVGVDKKKGNLGSPYAIKNPYKIEESLNEPALSFDSEFLFKAFCQAAHILGIKVVLEFVFRTASVDSDLALEHPECFYWIKSGIKNREFGSVSETEYGSPVFSYEELIEIKSKVLAKDFTDLPSPGDIFKNMFLPTPEHVENQDNLLSGKYSNGEKGKIPGAFADWPPDDIQPAWSDVTYLKLYESDEFNYIAYNTVRMYDELLSAEENEIVFLWDYISSIIPHYQTQFGIDGVMIDMGHALPLKLSERIIYMARQINPEFIFWEENFNLNKESLDFGYDASLGYLPFDAHIPYKMKGLVDRFAQKDVAIPFFATAETHNTKRVAARFNSVAFSKFIYAFSSLLQAYPFIHSGFELCETTPVNTGLGFDEQEILSYPAGKLGLFSACAYDWNKESNIIDFIKQINLFRRSAFPKGLDFENFDYELIETNSDNIIAFSLMKAQTKNIYYFVGNMNNEADDCFSLILSDYDIIFNIISNHTSINRIENRIELTFKPHGFTIIHITQD